MVDMSAGILECVHLDDSHVVMTLDAREIAAASRPGHFAMLGVGEETDPLLRRPLGIMDAESDRISFFFQVAGRGTALLSRKRPGDKVPVLGPLGNPFPEVSGRSILAVAGGRGIAPLLFALKEYQADNRVCLVYGARRAAELHLRDRIGALGLAKTVYCTEAGDFGIQGLVTDHLAEILSEQSVDMTISCGPHAMLAAMASRLESTGTEDYMSAEAIMGCGIGACHSCVVPGKTGGYLRVCRDGPVFLRESVQWRT